MTFEKSISTCLAKYATFDGNALRYEYWWWFILVASLIAGSRRR